MLKNTVTYAEIIVVVALVAFIAIEPCLPQSFRQSRVVTSSIEIGRSVSSGLRSAQGKFARTMWPFARALRQSVSTWAEVLSNEAGQVIMTTMSQFLKPY